jgi:hypothetical protein
MYHIACTRFTDETWEENILFRNKNGEKVIYGSSVKIREIYNKGCLLFVAEMNNQQNKIEGIGLIRNLLVDDKHKIYKNSEYNRFIYRGNYWLSRKQLIDIDADIVEILDNILFKGKSNLKRFLGITILTKKLFTNWNYELSDLVKRIKNVFLRTFRKDIHIHESESESELELL